VFAQLLVVALQPLIAPRKVAKVMMRKLMSTYHLMNSSILTKLACSYVEIWALPLTAVALFANQLQ
jgi:hypothetical protein